APPKERASSASNTTARIAASPRALRSRPPGSEAAPLQTALAGYLALELIAHLTRAAATGELSGSPQYGPSYYWPTTHAPSVALGMVIGLARTPRDRLAALGAFALHALLSHMAFDDRSLAPLAIGTLLLLATARLPLPQILVAPVTTISAASLFIYLLHWPLAHLLHRFGETPPAVTALLTIALALAVWAASRRVAEPVARAIARAAWSAARGGAGLGRAQAAAKSSADSA
ncbi:MAG: acyltransferase family protein, partial [Pseudomonadota bacterium]